MKKKESKKIIIVFVIIGILLFGFLGYKVYNDFIKNTSVNKKLMSLDLYGYTLSENDSTLYKDNFKELESVLNEKPINYEEYAKLISKLFVIDVFTLDNKLASTDIGGLEFLHKDIKENFSENMGATLYKNVESNLDGKRNQELPKVSNVNVDNILDTKYTYNEKEYDAYIVTLSYEYEKDMGYQNNIKLTIINDNEILYIVKGE